ncbi:MULTISPECIES: coproporphyrinogen-III oxidase family protein [unclassified Rubrivivax]|uniref:coproporphyrinogen-III oxidase family protein n=1 Tax=unclassified Rubrivivax TaxID=2649762 RepID=UPI001E42DCE6|nr:MULTISPECIES: radical SAM protein [unclassified Rubrivivax]MCC9598143.1 radical SAM protein [Rubrivivax sp. JA1055]MCC9645600.1 radical SAM protein [Rubrivivax sp. JA1029]
MRTPIPPDDSTPHRPSASVLKIANLDAGASMCWQPPQASNPLVQAMPHGEAQTARSLYEAALRGLAARADEPIAVSARVPFCAAHCFCCDRDIRAAQPDDVIDDYVAGLVEEIREVAQLLGGRREVLQFHLGGGTASELTGSQLARLVQAMQSEWRMPADIDMSCECDPRRVSQTMFEVLRGLGFRRVSLGVLDLDPGVQQAIGRRQSAALIDDVCELARSAGIEYINLDVMIGLPRQTMASWCTTIDRLIAMGPERIRLARYHHRPWHAPAQVAIDTESLPSPALMAELARASAEMLRNAGYRWIGADQFVLEHDDLSHAMDDGRLRRSLISYTAAPATPLIGLGVGAVGEVDGAMFWNDGSQAAWRNALRHGRLPVAQARPATPDSVQRRAAVERLLCSLELPAAQAQGLEEGYGRLAAREADGLVRVFDDRIVVTETGRHALHALCTELDEPGAQPEGRSARCGC